MGRPMLPLGSGFGEMEVCYCPKEAISSSEFFRDPKFEETATHTRPNHPGFSRLGLGRRNERQRQHCRGLANPALIAQTCQSQTTHRLNSEIQCEVRLSDGKMPIVLINGRIVQAVGFIPKTAALNRASLPTAAPRSSDLHRPRRAGSRRNGDAGEYDVR